MQAEKMEPQGSRGRLEGQVKEVHPETEEEKEPKDLQDPSETLDVMDSRVWREKQVLREQLGSLAFLAFPGPQGRGESLDRVAWTEEEESQAVRDSRD